MYGDQLQELVFRSEMVKLERTCFAIRFVNLGGEKGAAGAINSRVVFSK